MATFSIETLEFDDQMRTLSGPNQRVALREKVALDKQLKARSLLAADQWGAEEEAYLAIYKQAATEGIREALPYESDPFHGPDS